MRGSDVSGKITGIDFLSSFDSPRAPFLLLFSDIIHYCPLVNAVSKYRSACFIKTVSSISNAIHTHLYLASTRKCHQPQVPLFAESTQAKAEYKLFIKPITRPTRESFLKNNTNAKGEIRIPDIDLLDSEIYQNFTLLQKLQLRCFTEISKDLSRTSLAAPDGPLHVATPLVGELGSDKIHSLTRLSSMSTIIGSANDTRRWRGEWTTKTCPLVRNPFCSHGLDKL